PAAGDLGEVRAERRGVDRDEYVRRVARRQDVARGEVDLECGNACERAGRSADLGREVRQRREVVPHHRRRVGEPRTGELHAIAGVTGEPHDDLLTFLDCLAHAAVTYSLLSTIR